MENSLEFTGSQHLKPEPRDKLVAFSNKNEVKSTYVPRSAFEFM